MLQTYHLHSLLITAIVFEEYQQPHIWCRAWSVWTSKYFAQSASQRCSLELLRFTQKYEHGKLSVTLFSLINHKFFLLACFSGISQQPAIGLGKKRWNSLDLKVFHLEYFLLEFQVEQTVEFPAEVALSLSRSLSLYRSFYRHINLFEKLVGWLADTKNECV